MCSRHNYIQFPGTAHQIKSQLCDHISVKWESVKSMLANADLDTTVQMQHFEKVEHISKSGNISKHLTAVKTDANMEFIIGFITDLLTKIVHHLNLLKNYRTISKDFNEYFDDTNIDIDFSESLSVPIKYEPQSLHWHHEQCQCTQVFAKWTGKRVIMLTSHTTRSMISAL